MRFRHLVIGVVAGAALLASACGGDAQGPAEPATTSVATTGSAAEQTATAAEPTATTEATAATDAPATTTADDQPPAPTTTAAPLEEPTEEVVTTTVAQTTLATEPAAVPEGPPVPAVTLELDDGTTFVSTEAARPVLYLFWAEW